MLTEYKYRSKGGVSHWEEEATIEAESREDALEKLDKLYGIVRDDQGNQTNSEFAQIELL